MTRSCDDAETFHPPKVLFPLLVESRFFDIACSCCFRVDCELECTDRVLGNLIHMFHMLVEDVQLDYRMW